MPSPSSNPEGLSGRIYRRRDPVEAFRRQSTKGRIRKEKRDPWGASIRERVLVFLAILTLTLNVWGFGGTSWWVPTVVTFYAGLAALIWTLLPLPWRFDLDASPIQTTASANLKRLIRFPLFWLGLLLFAYMSISIFNQFATFHTDGQEMWFEPLSYITWLPAGLDTPFEDMNALRTVMLYAGPWMFLCALMIGLNHRRSLLVILYAIALNGVGLAMYGGWFRSQGYYSGVFKIYGLINFSWFGFPHVWTVRPYGPVLNPNQAATFLNMALGANLGLIVFRLKNCSVVEELKRTRLWLLLIFLFILASGQLFTASKAGVVLGCGVLLAGVFLVFFQELGRGKRKIRTALAGGAIILGLAFASYAVAERLPKLMPELSAGRIAALEGLKESGSFESRMLFMRQTWRMYLDEPWKGHGAGTYRYRYNHYSQNLKIDTEDEDRTTLGRLNYAHCDYLQFLAEQGAIGMLLLLLPLAAILCRVLSSINYFVLAIGIGCSAVLLHAIADFPFSTVLNCLALAFLVGVILKYQILTDKFKNYG